MGKNIVWIEANIFVNEGRQNEVLLTFIKPLVQRLRSEFNILAYHFLHEPNNEIRFRVLTTPENVEEIRRLIDEAERMGQVREVSCPETPYHGERQAFGEDGWKTTYKFLETGSDFALDLIDRNVRKGPNFNCVAFSHYFLNQSGFNQLQEANFHATASIAHFDAAKELEKKMTGKMTQLEVRIQAIEERQQTTGESSS